MENYPNTRDYSEQSDEIDLKKIIVFIWQEKWVLFSIVSVSLLLGMLFVFFYPRTFTASLEVLPISTFEEEAYAELNALDYFSVTKESLLSLFIAKLQARDVLTEAFKYSDYLSSSNFETIDAYNFALRELSYSVDILPPTLDKELAKIRNTEQRENWVIKFQGSNIKEYKVALEFFINAATDQVRQALIRRLQQKIQIANTLKVYDLENLNLSILNLKQDYDRQVSDKLEFLNEQAQIARQLGIAKNTIESQSFSTPNSVVTSIKTDSPLYLRGYKAIEKEIELIESRNNKEAFIGELPNLEIKIRELKQDPIVQRATLAFDKTPIVLGPFKAVQTDIAALNVEYKLKPTVVLTLSLLLGIMVGLFIIFVKNVIRPSITSDAVNRHA